MDATLPIPDQQRRMRELVRPYLHGVRRLRSSTPDEAWAGLVQEIRPTRTLAQRGFE